MADDTLRLLPLADLHTGSLFAPWPRGFTFQDGGQWQLNKFQDYITACWEDMVAQLPRLDLVVLNGDTIDGENIKERGHYTVTTDTIEQARATTALLHPLREKTKEMLLLWGSPYHGGLLEESLHLIARELDCTPLSPWDSLVLTRKWGKIYLNISHSNTGGWIYPAGGADRMALFMRAAREPGTLIIRGHLHFKRILKAHGRWVILCPGWKLLSPYAIRTMEYSRARMLCDIGAVLVEQDTLGQLKFVEFEYDQFHEWEDLDAQAHPRL